MSIASDEKTEGFLTREELLSPPGLDEEVVELEGFGKVLCVELTGEARARISEAQSKKYQAGEVDILGIADPTSPDDARVPLLRDADVPGLMKKLGGGKVRSLIATIEKLSAMGINAVAVVETAKGDSDALVSGAGTSE